MSNEKRATYLSERREYFMSLLDAVERKSTFLKEHDMDMIDASFTSNVDYWFKFEMIETKGARWADHVEWVEMFYQNIINGNLVIKDMDDIHALTCMFSHDFRSAPEAVQYYVATGQILNLVHMIIQDSITLVHHSGQKAVLIKIYELYAYEVSMIEEYLARGESSEEFINLPLEIKLSFSGVPWNVGYLAPVQYATDAHKELLCSRNHLDVFHYYSETMEIPERFAPAPIPESASF